MGLFDRAPGVHRSGEDYPYADNFKALQDEVAADIQQDPQAFVDRTVEVTGLRRQVVSEQLSHLLQRGFDQPANDAMSTVARG